MLIKVLLAILFTLPIAQLAKADLYTPISVNLNHEEFTTVLNRYFNKGFAIEDSLSEIPKIPGLKASYSKVNYSAQVNPSFNVDSNGRLTIDSDVPFAFFEMHDLKLHHQMVRRVGSVKVNINTKIECEYLKISLKEKIRFEVEGEFIKSKPLIKKALLPSNLDFKIDFKNCIAPKDFENFLPELALEWLNSIDGEKEILKFLNDEIVKNFWVDLKKGLEIEFLGRKIYLALLQINNSNTNFNVNFMVRWPKEDSFYLNMKEPVSLNSLAIKTSDLDLIFKKWITKGCFDLVFFRKDISGIEKLFGNRLYQFFIWGDLANFKKEADFNLKIKICLDDFKLQKVFPKENHIYHFIDSGAR
jgi:hypothetical protein